jgi:hypothetical protein
MKTQAIVLPFLALGAAALLIVPGTQSHATFSLTGESLNTNQRDIRLFNNFADAQTNNNTTVFGMFPGFLGAEQATRKGVTEWASLPHGTGGGDPTQGSLGNGGANFDAAWMGNASGVGTTDNNIISPIASCGGGVLAYAELPASNGWRIRVCDNWTWADGPSTSVGSQWDLQGVITHEYGHVLGLGHSCVGSATMAPSGSPGSISERSINFDDIAGIQAVYGTAAASKPTICETSSVGGVVTIKGTNFDATSNAVWFTNKNVTTTGTDPRIQKTNIASSAGGTVISLTIPANASAGDVLVKLPGGAVGMTLSNAFPIALDGTITAAECEGLSVNTMSSPIPALVPGTDQTVTLTGSGLNDVTSLVPNAGSPIDASRWTIVNDGTITIDMPQTGMLGVNSLAVNTASGSESINFTVAVTATPQFELGTGEDNNVILNGSNMSIIVAGTPGTLHRIYCSTSSVPSVHPVVSFALGNNFTNLFFGGAFTIGVAGYTQIDAPVSYFGPLATFYCQTLDVTTAPSPMYGVSNLQIIDMVP